jgi:hypothetical protein
VTNTTVRALIRICGVLSVPELILKAAYMLGLRIYEVHQGALFWSIVGCAIWIWSEIDWYREATYLRREGSNIGQ